MYLFDKHVSTPTSSYTYICLGHNKRVDGKIKRVLESIICQKDKIEESLPLIKRKLSGRLPAMKAEESRKSPRGIKEIHAHYNDNLPPDIDLTQMSSLQKLMVKVLDLKRKYLP